jgi:hypothetical protein
MRRSYLTQSCFSVAIKFKVRSWQHFCGNAYDLWNSITHSTLRRDECQTLSFSQSGGYFSEILDELYSAKRSACYALMFVLFCSLKRIMLTSIVCHLFACMFDLNGNTRCYHNCHSRSLH